MLMQRAVIILAEGHAAARRSDDRQLGLKCGILVAQFSQGRDDHFGGAMQSPALSTIEAGIQAAVWDLSGSLTATFGRIEGGHGRNAVLIGFKRCQRLFQAESEGANHAGSNHHDPGRGRFSA